MKRINTLSLPVVFKIIGWLLLIEGIILLIPLIFSLFESDGDWKGFLVACLSSMGCGGLLTWVFRHTPVRMRRREGYLLTSVIWILFSAFGMIPFVMCGTPLSVADAYFETMSGFTTTGATVICDVESCSRSILLWRSVIQWIGGLGIVLFMLALLPSLNSSGGVTMYNSEVTGITHDKLHPSIRHTAKSLWSVYLVLTVALFICLYVGPMDFFDALCQSLTTMATGGFSTKNTSIAGFGSNYIAVVLSVFMIIGGTNFVLLYNAVRGDWRSLWRNDVLRAYLLIILSAVAIVDIAQIAGGGEVTAQSLIINPVFLVSSAITSTGFTYLGGEGWGQTGLLVIMLLMFTGACAGSTTGAVKVDRIVAMRKNFAIELGKTLFPNHVRCVEVSGKTLSESLTGRISAFISLYFFVVMVLTFVLCAYGIDFTDSIFAVLSCVGNNGLGYGVTAAGFGVLPDFSKWLLSAGMLIGRLEIFTVLAVFTATFWRK